MPAARTRPQIAGDDGAAAIPRLCTSRQTLSVEVRNPEHLSRLSPRSAAAVKGTASRAASPHQVYAVLRGKADVKFRRIVQGHPRVGGWSCGLPRARYGAR